MKNNHNQMSAAAPNNNRFKIVLFGDHLSGKTTYLIKFLTKKFQKRYVGTLGVDVHPLHVSTTSGEYVLDVWDTAGPQRGGLEEGYFVGADQGLFFTNLQTDPYVDANKVDSWKKIHPKKLLRTVMTCQDIPSENTEFNNAISNNPPYPIYGVSSKTDDGMWTPIRDLLRELTNDETLCILDIN